MTTKVVTAEVVGLVSTEADVGLVFCVFLPDGGTVIADVADSSSTQKATSAPTATGPAAA